MKNEKNLSLIGIVLIASAALHAGMLATGYVQEDAFITFRTAFNFADHGVYSFNLDEQYPGATSLFYGFFVALIRYFAKESAIVIIGLTNISFVLAGGYLLFLAVKKSWIFTSMKGNASLAIVLLSATASPALLKISSSGMETASLFFMFCLALWALSKNNLYVLCGSLALLPFVRIDSAGFCLIAIACLFFQSKRQAVAAFLAFAAGFGLLLLFNTLVFDSVLPLTAKAKLIAFSPDRSILAISETYLGIMFTKSFLLGVSTKYIHSYVYVFIALTFLLPVALVLYRFYKNIFFLRTGININQSNSTKSSKILQYDLPVYVIAFATVLIPLGYSIGGIIFPWYLWSFSSLVFVLVIGFFLSRGPDNVIEYCCLALIACLAVTTIFININISEQENRYRASIGRFIKQISNPKDTLFLEPAGYIPFFSGIKTYDTVGLTSAKILKYHKQYRKEWWIRFVSSETPSFIIDRSPIHLIKATEDGGYSLTDAEYAWFMDNYVLEAAFNYEKYLDANKTSLYGIHRLGSSSDYFLYKRKNGSIVSR